MSRGGAETVSTSRADWGLLARQLTAHRAWVLRRLLRELAGTALLRLSRLLPPLAPAARRVARAPASHEVPVLTTFSQTLARRRTRERTQEVAPEIDALLRDGRIEEATARARDFAAGGARTGARVDALLRVGEAALERKQLDVARESLEQALRLDSGRADAWRALGELALASGEPHAARPALVRATDLDPRDVRALATLGDAWGAEDVETARGYWWRALERAPGDDDLVRRIERSALVDRSAAERVELTLDGSEVTLEVDGEAELAVEVTATGGAGALYVLEPFGGGLECEPHGRIPLDPGAARVTLRLRATRPDTANAGRPWRLELAGCGAERIERASLHASVPDREPGEIYHLITEDHEIYDERESTGADEAEVTLVAKSKLAEEIANARGARWTHMVDVGSIALVEWAAERSARWSALAEACREHLVSSVAAGNDLGLHLHGFHDPTSRGFCHDFDAATDRVTTRDHFLDLPLPQRRFWSREYEALGDVDEAGTRAWGTWRGVGRLEALGRLGDPAFRVTLFRAGSFDFGEDARDRDRSLALLSRLGVRGDSDVPKPRLYHRAPDPSAYPVSEDPWRPETDAARVRALEIRPEYNVEADYLSDTGVLNRYVDRRVDAVQTPDGVAPGVHVICCMTHDKFINFRMGRDWDRLDPDYGDWATIDAHLAHVAERQPQVRFATCQQVLLAWWERHGPELLAWRAEEVVVLAPPEATEHVYRYPIRLVGRGIGTSPERRRRVRVEAPAWLQGRVREACVERGRAPWPARELSVGPLALEFEVDDRSADFELVVTAEAGDGITVQREGERLRLRSRHHYRRAHVEIPAEWTAGEPRRLRDLALAPAADGFEGEVRLG